MASYNKVLLIGNLTRDPELRFTTEGKAVCEFTLGVNGMAKEGDQKSANFIPIVAWEKLATACSDHLQKGSLVHVDGRMKQERWEKDGKKLSKLTVVANKVEFLSGTKKADKNGKGGKPTKDAGAQVDPSEEGVVSEEEAVEAEA